MKELNACLLCLSDDFEKTFDYTSPPLGENYFSELAGKYQRSFWQCKCCGHFQAQHDYDLAQMYSGAYNQSLYSGDKLKQTFERILALPTEKSDNQGRVKYIQDFCSQWQGFQSHNLLDIGSGTGVFPFLMKQVGWNSTASDPDPLVAEHLSKTAELNVICGDFFDLKAEKNYELLSFNKVLEHVVNPVAMLNLAHQWLLPGGLVYIELPDGEAASQDGPGREEFFIEHYHAFSAASFSLLLKRTGFRLLKLESLKEPSSKYTLRGFAQSLS
jgi:SAM-dependent methyltransferase